jgi:hypothetical protein
LVTNSAAVVWLWRRRKERQVLRWLAGWLVLQLVPLMLYLPWLPIAWRQLSNWPAPPPVEAGDALGTVWRTLVFGPVGLEVSNVWLLVFGLLMLVGLGFWEKSLPKISLLLLYLTTCRPDPWPFNLPIWFLLPFQPHSVCLPWVCSGDVEEDYRWQVRR